MKCCLREKFNLFQMYISEMPDRAIQLYTEFSPLGKFKLAPKQYLMISPYYKLYSLSSS